MIYYGTYFSEYFEFHFRGVVLKVSRYSILGWSSLLFTPHLQGHWSIYVFFNVLKSCQDLMSPSATSTLGGQVQPFSILSIGIHCINLGTHFWNFQILTMSHGNPLYEVKAKVQFQTFPSVLYDCNILFNYI